MCIYYNEKEGFVDVSLFVASFSASKVLDRFISQMIRGLGLFTSDCKISLNMLDPHSQSPHHTSVHHTRRIFKPAIETRQI